MMTSFITSIKQRFSSAAMGQAIYYGLGLVMMKGISLFMLPVFTSYLSTTEYGRLEVLLALANIGTLILGFGLVDSLYRFAGMAENDQQRREVSARAFGLTTLITLAALLVVQLAAPLIAQLLPGTVEVFDVRLLGVALAVEGCLTIPLAWLRMRERAKQFFVLTTSKVILQAGLSYALLQQGWGISGILVASAVSAVLLAVVLSVLHIKDVGFSFSWISSRQLLRYGVPMVISGMAGFALSGLDRWLLADVVGEAALAPYAVAAKFSLVTLLLMQPFTLWWYPQRFRLLNQTKGIEKNAHYAVLGSTLVIIISGAVGVCAPWLIRWLTPEAYHVAIVYVPWLVLATALKIISDLLNLGCYTSTNSRLQMQINLVCTCVGVALFAALIPSWGIGGVVAALVISNTLRLILFYYKSQNLLYLPYCFRPLFQATTFSALMIVAGQVVTL
ncbi:lipopolysaccharide biosynthesis protein [Pseudomonadota bacterium]